MRVIRFTWLAGLLLVVGCGGPPEGTWVSRLEGTDAWLAVRVQGDQAAAYVCGGPTTLQTHSRWMRAGAKDDTLDFAADGWSLSFEREQDRGELIDPDGVTLAFDAHTVAEGGLDGLYTAFDAGCRDGLIIDGGASQGTWCDSSGIFEEVTPLMPLALTDQGIAVSVQVAAMEHQFFMATAVVDQITP